MHYLVAVDGSESSVEALEHAIGLAGRLDAELTVVYAVEPEVLVEGGDSAPPFPESADRLYTESLEEAETRGERILDDAAARAAEANVVVETELLYGDPVDSVAEYAVECDADGIVVGHRGLSERIEGMVGSVAKGLVQTATVPVTVVH